MQVLFELMVQIKQKRGIGVENPSARTFSGDTHQTAREASCRLVGVVSKGSGERDVENYKRNSENYKREVEN